MDLFGQYKSVLIFQIYWSVLLLCMCVTCGSEGLVELFFSFHLHAFGDQAQARVRGKHLYLQDHPTGFTGLKI